LPNLANLGDASGFDEVRQLERRPQTCSHDLSTKGDVFLVQVWSQPSKVVISPLKRTEFNHQESGYEQETVGMQLG